MGWSVLRLCHQAWCLQSFLSMKNPSFKPRAHTLSPPAAFRSNVCNLFMCFHSGMFQASPFPLRCLCSYQSSQKTQASETLFGLSEVVWTRAVFLLWHYHRVRWARFVPWGNTTLSCAQWLADEQAMMWHYCHMQAKVRWKSVAIIFCCWQEIVTFPLYNYFLHARLFSLYLFETCSYVGRCSV